MVKNLINGSTTERQTTERLTTEQLTTERLSDWTTNATEQLTTEQLMTERLKWTTNIQKNPPKFCMEKSI